MLCMMNSSFRSIVPRWSGGGFILLLLHDRADCWFPRLLLLLLLLDELEHSLFCFASTHFPFGTLQFLFDFLVLLLEFRVFFLEDDVFVLLFF